jgi:hypothetical protein
LTISSGSLGLGANSTRPASILEKSSTPLTMDSSARAESLAVSA